VHLGDTPAVLLKQTVANKATRTRVFYFDADQVGSVVITAGRWPPGALARDQADPFGMLPP